MTLENHFRDMRDIEFTIEQGKLWMLQTRVGKRTAAAAHIAIEMEKEGLISASEPSCCRPPEQPGPAAAPAVRQERLLRRAAKGSTRPRRRQWARPCSAADAVAVTEAGRARARALGDEPDDLAGMIAAEASPTRRTAARRATRPSSPAAWARCASAGVEALKIDAEKKEAVKAGTDIVIREGDMIPSTARRLRGKAGCRGPRATRAHRRLDTILEWATSSAPWAWRAERRQPRQDAELCNFGAEGIGSAVPSTCSRATASRSSSPSSSTTSRPSAKASRPAGGPDGRLTGMFKAMDGLPVIVRLLDPPLHEFESLRDLVEIVRLEVRHAGRRARRTSASRLEPADAGGRGEPGCSACAAAAWPSSTPSCRLCRRAPSPPTPPPAWKKEAWILV